MSDAGKEFRVRVTVRNNRLLSLREAEGKTQKQIADLCGVSNYMAFETMRANPLVQKKDSSYAWSAPAQRIAAFFEREPEYLWPDCVLKIRTVSREVSVGESELCALSSSGRFIALPEGSSPQEQEHLAQDVRKALTGAMRKVLTPKEMGVLSRRFGFDGNDEHTLEEIAEDEIWTRERVRQIEARAISKLRHPQSTSILRNAVDMPRYGQRRVRILGSGID